MFSGFDFSELWPLILLWGGMIGLPVGVPPAKEDPVLARIAPADCLFYSSWSGVAEPDPKSANHTERLLAEDEIREFLADLERLIRTNLATYAEQEGTPQAKLLAEMIPKWGKAVLTRPTVLYVTEVKRKPGAPLVLHAGFMMHAGDNAAELKALIEKLQADSVRTPIRTVKIGSGTFQQFQIDPAAPLVTWGLNGNYLVAGLGEGTVEGMLERAKGAPPKWLAELRKDLPVARPASVAYADIKRIMAIALSFAEPEAEAAVEALGLGNITRFACVTGLDETGFVSKTQLRLDGEPKGVLGPFAAKPLTKAGLAGIPHDTPFAFSLRLSAADLLATFIKLAEQIEPGAGEEIEEELASAEEELDLKFRAEIFGSLGDAWTVHAAPGAGGLWTGWTATVGIKDRERLERVHAKLLALARDFADDEFAPRIREFKCAGQDCHYLSPSLFDDMPFAPAWCLTKDRLVFALYPQALKSHLMRSHKGKSLADLPEVARLFDHGEGPLVLSYFDSKELARTAYPFLQIAARYALGFMSEFEEYEFDLDLSIFPSMDALLTHLKPGTSTIRRTAAGLELETRSTLPSGNLSVTAPVVASLLLPAASAMAEAGQKTQAKNHLREIGLAMHNFVDSHDKLPAAYSTDKDGKALLSWRVHILPFLEQEALYEQFHLDEPWDSPHNKKLIAKIPPVYVAPGSKAEAGKTNLLAIRSMSSVIAAPGAEEKGKRIPLGVGLEFPDGTSNTAMVVEASDERAVFWTKPDDYTPDDMAPAKGLTGLRVGGFFVLLADGSVKFLKENVDAELLKNLYDRQDGNAIRLP